MASDYVTEEMNRLVKALDEREAELASAHKSAGVFQEGNRQLRAALAEAERKLEALEDSESCDAITLRTKLAEAERARDSWMDLAVSAKAHSDAWASRAERAEADLAAARDVIEALLAFALMAHAQADRGLGDGEPISMIDARAFLERTAPETQKIPVDP